MVERAEMTCRLLDVRYGHTPVSSSAHHHWLGTLKSASASEAYRKAHRASLMLADYERRNRWVAPLVRRVLSWLVGWRYDGSDGARRRQGSDAGRVRAGRRPH